MNIMPMDTGGVIKIKYGIGRYSGGKLNNCGIYFTDTINTMII